MDAHPAGLVSLEEDRHRNGHPWEDAGQNAECRQRCECHVDRPRTPGAAGDTGGEEEGTEQALLPGLREGRALRHLRLGLGF